MSWSIRNITIGYRWDEVSPDRLRYSPDEVPEWSKKPTWAGLDLRWPHQLSRSRHIFTSYGQKSQTRPESVLTGADDLQDRVRKLDSCKEKKREREEVKKQGASRMPAHPLVTNIVPNYANTPFPPWCLLPWSFSWDLIVASHRVLNLLFALIQQWNESCGRLDSGEICIKKRKLE